MAALPGRTTVTVHVVVVPLGAVGHRCAAEALSGPCLPLVDEPLRFLLRGAEGYCGQCHPRTRSPSCGLALTGVGGVVSKRALLADLGEPAVKAAAVRSRSLRTHSGTAYDLENTKRRVTFRRSYRACCLVARSSSDTMALEPEGPSVPPR